MHSINNLKKIILTLCLFSLSFTCLADNNGLKVAINGNEQGRSLHRSTFYLIDPESKYTAETVSNSNHLESYQQLQTSNSWIKKTKGSVWIRMILTNTNKSEVNINLEYPYNQLKTIYMYHRPLNSSQAFIQTNTDIRETGNDRTVPVAHLTLPLTLHPHETKEVILQTYSDIEIPRFTEFRVWSNQAMINASNIEHIIFGMVVCFIVIASLISMILFKALKEKFFLWFSLFAISSIPVLGLTSGILNLYISSLNYHPTGTVSVVVMIAAGIQFIRAFSNLSFHSLKADRLLHITLMLVLTTIPIAMLGFYEVAIQIQQLAIFIFPIAIIAAIYCGVLGEREMSTMILAKVLFFITLIATNLQAWGWVNPSYGIVFLPTIGMVSQLVCLIWAMYCKAKMHFELNNKESIKSITNAYERASAMQQQVVAQNKKLMKAKEKAELEARTDVLTQLPNRRSFIYSAKIAILEAQQKSLPLSVINFDIDNFKVINDEYGHPAGDQALKTVAQITKQIIRNSDFCGRIGGEEFMVCCNNMDIVQAQQIAERIRKKVSNQMIKFDKYSFSCTISIGIANIEPNDNLESLIKKSDTAMYHSKVTGKNKVTLYNKQQDF